MLRILLESGTEASRVLGNIARGKAAVGA